MRHSARGVLQGLSAAALLTCALVDSTALAAFYNGPYLQQVSQSSVLLMWETDVNSSGTVHYGTTQSYGQQASDAVNGTLHSVRLSGLQANTLYYYKVEESGGQVRTGSFRTAPRPGTDFVFAAYGDNRTNPDDHVSVADAILSHSPSLVVTTGDYVETTGLWKQWHNQFFTPAADLLARTPILPAIGNHDSTVGHPRSPVYKYFPKPGETNYYSFDYGDIHFVVVDSNISYSTSSAQYAWLQKDLAATTQPVIIAVHHHPVLSSGNHGSTVQMDSTLRPLYEQFGVTAVLNGHDHMYERSTRNGVQYFVLGGGGAGLYDPNDSPNPYAVKNEKTLNYGIFNWKAGKLSITAYRPDGSTIETVQLYPATTLARATPADEGNEEDLEAGGCGMGEGDEAFAGASLLSLIGLAGLAGIVRRVRR